MDPEELVERIAADLDRIAPSEFAGSRRCRARRVAGGRRPVRRAHARPVGRPGARRRADPDSSFRLRDAEGHLEAGQIDFAARRRRRRRVPHRVWRAAGDRLSHLLYNHLRWAKEVQLHMWTSVLERVVELTGGRGTGGVAVASRRRDARGGARPSRRRRRSPSWAQRRQFRRDEAKAPVRIGDLDGTESSYCPAGRAGQPYEAARLQGHVAHRLMRDYRVADPGRPFSRPTTPGRSWTAGDVRLRAALRPRLRFHVGVRGRRDQRGTRVLDGREARASAWSHATSRRRLRAGTDGLGGLAAGSTPSRRVRLLARRLRLRGRH